MNPHWVPNYPNNGMSPQQANNIYNPNAHSLPSNSSHQPILTHIPHHPSPYPPPPFNSIHAPPPPPTHLFGYHTAHNVYPNWSPNVPAYSQPFPPVMNTFQGTMPINNNTWVPNPHTSNPTLPPPPPPPQLHYMAHTRKRLRPDGYLQQPSNNKSRAKSIEQGANIQNNSNSNAAQMNRCNPQNNAEKTKKDSKNGRQDGSYKDLINSKRILGRYGVNLPGESKQDIDKWVAERKRRWPSKRNVEKKLAEVAQKKEENERKKMLRKKEKEQTKEVSALTSIANDYGSSEDEEGDKKDIEKKKENNQHGKEDAKIEKLPKKGRVQKRGRKKTKRNKSRNGGVQQVMIKQSKRPLLLKQLLQNEIRKEQSILLQAFRFLLEKNDESQEH